MDLNHLNLRVRDAAACRDFYQHHFGFMPAFEADDGYFLQNSDGFLLALVPASTHTTLPDGFHVGFRLESIDAVRSAHDRLTAGAVAATAIDDASDVYVTFRCWDPDGTEIEVFWQDS